MQLKTFFRLASGVGAITVMNQALVLVLGIVLARWLGVEGYGTYAFVMSVVVLLLILARLGLPNLLMREIAAGRGEVVDWVWRSGSLVFGASVLLVLVVTFVTLALELDPAMQVALLVGLWLLPLLGFLEVVSHALLGMRQPIFSELIRALLPALLTLSVAGILAWQTPDNASAALAGRLGAIFCTVIVAGAFLRWSMGAPSFQTTASTPTLGTIVRKGLPFMLIEGGARIMSSTDVVMLGLLLGPSEVGIYNVALQGALLVQLILSTANKIVAPEFSRLHADGDMRALERFAISTTRATIAVAFPIMVILVIYGEALLGLAFGQEFSTASEVLSMLAIGFVVVLFFGEPGFMLNMTGYEDLTLRVYLAAGVLNIALNFILIPTLGASGAALSTLTTLLLQRIITWWLVRKRLGISIGFLGRGLRI